MKKLLSLLTLSAAIALTTPAATAQDSYTIPAIEQRYDRDDRFRDMVTRYMGKFEDLLRESNTADPESVLNATFITADVGKLYLVLSRSLDRTGHRKAS